MYEKRIIILFCISLPILYMRPRNNGPRSDNRRQITKIQRDRPNFYTRRQWATRENVKRYKATGRSTVDWRLQRRRAREVEENAIYRTRTSATNGSSAAHLPAHRRDRTRGPSACTTTITKLPYRHFVICPVSWSHACVYRSSSKPSPLSATEPTYRIFYHYITWVLYFNQWRI